MLPPYASAISPFAPSILPGCPPVDQLHTTTEIGGIGLPLGTAGGAVVVIIVIILIVIGVW